MADEKKTDKSQDLNQKQCKETGGNPQSFAPSGDKAEDKTPEQKPQEKKEENPNPAEKQDKTEQSSQASEPGPVSKRRILLGRLMMILGVLLVVGAMLLYTLNRQQSNEAGKASAELLPQVQQVILEDMEAQTEPTLEHVNPYDQEAVAQSEEMTSKVINGWRYIGYLTIPDIQIQLPVMSDWSYRKLQIAPCRHMGSTKSDDLVIAAHNYPTHFGKLKDLQQGSIVEFVDMDGVLSRYEVVTINVIAPTAIEEVEAPELDLVLYTCTYGGKSRVMVGCQRVSEDDL